ncbi:MAG: helix-turn-helix domain-containing protein [Desulfovibrio sp.]|jgi:ribosome-binding protein aMBF1 (putative translation factor)|nr:helix-turn-helix domain-containing protein [Desulfovibrio sp.]
MLERTKAHPTDCVELRFVVPASKADAVRRAVAPFIADAEAGVPWREALVIADAELPGAMVKGGRVKEGLTQAQLAALVGIPQRHVSEMEHGKRPIGKEMAKRLGKALGVGYKVFL